MKKYNKFQWCNICIKTFGMLLLVMFIIFIAIKVFADDEYWSASGIKIYKECIKSGKCYGRAFYKYSMPPKRGYVIHPDTWNRTCPICGETEIITGMAGGFGDNMQTEYICKNGHYFRRSWSWKEEMEERKK